MTTRDIHKEHLALVTIIYNGYKHRCLGERDTVSGPDVMVLIHHDQMPKGYAAEHGDEPIRMRGMDELLVPVADAEDHAWRCKLTIDFDTAANWKMID